MLLWTFSFKKHYKLIIDFLKIIVLKFLSKLEKAQTTMVWASFVHSHFLFLGIESPLLNIEYLFDFVKSYLQQSSHLSIRFVSTSGDIFSLSNSIFHLMQSKSFSAKDGGRMQYLCTPASVILLTQAASFSPANLHPHAFVDSAANPRKFLFQN